MDIKLLFIFLLGIESFILTVLQLCKNFVIYPHSNVHPRGYFYACKSISVRSNRGFSTFEIQSVVNKDSNTPHQMNKTWFPLYIHFLISEYGLNKLVIS